MSAKPIRVAVLAHNGTLLGYVTRKPTNGSWRSLGLLPRVHLKRPGQWPTTRQCETYGTGWAARLYENEPPPPVLEPA